MDRRALAQLFRDRLARLLAREPRGLARFARAAGLDRSALSQFLDPESDRLPRAETLVRLAQAGGTTVDWLLGLSNTPGGGQAVQPSIAIEMAYAEDGTTPLARWRAEAEGQKIRYVPSTLPDLLRLSELSDHDVEAARGDALREHGRAMLARARAGAGDVEVVMPLQTLEELAAGTGIWANLARETRIAQLRHMGALAGALYPGLRLHLTDARRSFSAPLTVFGLSRAAVFLGRSYLVVTAADQVQALARHFDGLVREAVVAPDRAGEAIGDLTLRAA